jgi:acetyl-CoA C-acetyltransferase/acetyl-CoA acyltransferase
MPTPVVVAARRTPQGREDGALADVRSEDLSVAVVDELLAETGLEGSQVDDLLWGCAQQRGEQGNNMARVISVLSDLGESVPATTINRWCASSAESVMRAADAVANGQREVLVAGGVESMSRVKIGENYGNVHPRIADLYNIEDLTMGMTAETVAEEFGVSREAQDEYALRSHERAADATDSGRFADEIVPVDTDDGTVTEDEGIRSDTSLEQLADLPTVFKEDGTVTPGNASQISDGAAGLLITSRSFADDHGLSVLADAGDHQSAAADLPIMSAVFVPASRSPC